MRDKGMHLAKSVIPAVYYIGFNMEDRTVGDPAGDRSRKLRQAMSLVVDAKEYTRLFINGRSILVVDALGGYSRGRPGGRRGITAGARLA